MSADEQKILEAVRTALGEEGLTRAGTGVFLRDSELAATLDHTLVPEHSVTYSIKQARIRRLEADAATVDLDATIVTVTKRQGFESRSTARAQGPVSLVREGGAWKVEDLVVHGVSLRACFFEGGGSGSAEEVELRVLGGRVFPTHIWVYLEFVNHLERQVSVQSVVVGQRRSLLPGWRWARGRVPVDTLPPGTTRFDASAALKEPHAGAPLRVLLKTDGGLVDARPSSVRRARRFVPLSVRYPWAWGSAIAAAIVCAVGLLLDWWIAGIVLVQVAAVTLFSFEGHLRRGMGRRLQMQLGWTIAGLGLGIVLFFSNGGFARFHGESDHDRVSAYVRAVTRERVVFAGRVDRERVGRCDFRVWDVRTPKHRWWAASIYGAHVLLPVVLYEHTEYATAHGVVVHQLAMQKQEAATLKKELGRRADALLQAC